MQSLNLFLAILSLLQNFILLFNHNDFRKEKILEVFANGPIRFINLKTVFWDVEKKKIENLLFSESTANVSLSRQPVLPDRFMFINFSQEMEDCG